MYDNDKIASLDLHMKPCARAALVLLDSQEPYFAEWDHKFDHYKFESNTFAWYNGRETGFVFEVKPPEPTQDDTEMIVFAVYEHRISDSCMVAEWRSNASFNGPTADDFDADAYLLAKGFNGPGRAVEYIIERLESIWDEALGGDWSSRMDANRLAWEQRESVAS